MDPQELVRLSPLMALTRGRGDVVIGLVDGPVQLNHPDLSTARIRTVAGAPGTCSDLESVSCQHGTFVAGILVARRGARAPAIAPACTLLVRPIFSEQRSAPQLPSTTPGELAEAIIDCVDGGARVVNLSAALIWPSIGGERELEAALEYTVRRGVLVVAAAGNQGGMGGSTITRHPWVLPVVACTPMGGLLGQSNLGLSVGRRGLGAPGEGVTSLAPRGEPMASVGTSVAAPFVTGAAALLWSAFPGAAAVEVKHALLSSAVGRRTVAPALLDAWGAYEVLSGTRARRAMP